MPAHGRVFAVIILFVLSASLGACGPSEDSRDTPTTPGSEPVSGPTPLADSRDRDRVSQTPTEADVFRIVMLGDSLTAGFGLPEQAALPVKLQGELSEQGVETELINAGVSGDTTASGLARYDWSVASNAPDLLLVALGANDFLMGVSPDVARMNLEAIIIRAMKTETPVVLIGLQQRGNAVDGSREAAFDGIYPELAAAYDLPLFPAMLQGVRDQPGLLQADGLHPTAEGVDVMAANIATFLGPIVVDLNPAE